MWTVECNTQRWTQYEITAIYVSTVHIPINLQNLITLTERFEMIKADARIHRTHTPMIMPIFALGDVFSPPIKRKPDADCLYGMFDIGVHHRLHCD
jgi:hypothetical protein